MPTGAQAFSLAMSAKRERRAAGEVAAPVGLGSATWLERERSRLQVARSATTGNRDGCCSSRI